MADNQHDHLGWIRNPEHIANLNRSRPDPNNNPSFVGKYDATPKGGRQENPSGPWVWCCHCQAPTHWNGYVVADNTGAVFLIGEVCARLHYGAARFKIAKRAFEDREYRFGLIRRAKDIRRLAPEILLEIVSLIDSPEMALIEAKRLELKNASPTAFDRLATAAASGASLSTVERVRGRKGKMEYAPVPIGRIDGPSLIYSAVRANSRAARSAIEDIARLEADAIESMESHALSLIVRRAEDAIRTLLADREEIASAPRFFMARNLRRLARWSSPMRQYYDISVDGADTLVINDAERGVSQINSLAAIKLPPLRLCRKTVAVI